MTGICPNGSAAAQGRSIQRPYDRRAPAGRPHAFRRTESGSQSERSQTRSTTSASGPRTSVFAAAPAAATCCSRRPQRPAGRASSSTSRSSSRRFFRSWSTFAGDAWRERYFAMKALAALHIQPGELGPPPSGEDPYESNNVWMLEQSRRFGPDKLDFVCLWNGESGDGPGGTRHMMEEAREVGGRVIDGSTRRHYGIDRNAARVPATGAEGDGDAEADLLHLIGSPGQRNDIAFAHELVDGFTADVTIADKGPVTQQEGPGRRQVFEKAFVSLVIRRECIRTLRLRPRAVSMTL